MPDDPRIGVTVEAVERLVPVTLERTLTPCRMILAVFGSRILFQHVHHIHRTQVRMGFPPCPVENAYLPILFSAPNVLDRGDPATQHIRSFPVLRAEINQLFLRRGDIVRRAECRLGGKGQTVQAGTAVQRNRDLPDTLCAVNRKNSLGACLRVAGQRRRADRHSVGIHCCQRGVAGLRENKPAAQRAAAEVHIARAENAGFLIRYQIIHFMLPFVLRSQSLPCLSPMSDTWYHTFSQKSTRKQTIPLTFLPRACIMVLPSRCAPRRSRRVLPGHGTDT